MGVNPEETVGDAHASATREVPSREKVIFSDVIIV